MARVPAIHRHRNQASQKLRHIARQKLGLGNRIAIYSRERLNALRKLAAAWSISGTARNRLDGTLIARF